MDFMLLVVFIFWLGSCCKSVSPPDLQQVKEVGELIPVENATRPPCDILFSKLELSSQGRKLIQDVKIQLRGEPKSGTKLAFALAEGILVHTCRYLQRAFGESSCVMEVQSDKDAAKGMREKRSSLLTFEPALTSGEARCGCDSVERVTIALTQKRKHILPVNGKCPYRHSGSIDERSPLDTNENGQGVKACAFNDGSTMTNYNDLWECVQDAVCPITDDWHLMNVFRDPRRLSVSAYYHLYRRDHIPPQNVSLDDFVIVELTLMTQWVAVRHIMFEEMLQDRSTSFWYDDAIEDPGQWHYRWLQMVGPQLPHSLVRIMINAAAAGDFGGKEQSMDNHPGEALGAEEGVRKFENEGSPQVLATTDDVLRQWLPNVLLARLNVPL